MRDRLVYTRFSSTAHENTMQLTVDNKARMIAFTEHDDVDIKTAVILMTPHRARAIGERLMEMADGIVASEEWRTGDDHQ